MCIFAHSMASHCKAPVRQLYTESNGSQQQTLECASLTSLVRCMMYQEVLNMQSGTSLTTTLLL